MVYEHTYRVCLILQDLGLQRCQPPSTCVRCGLVLEKDKQGSRGEAGAAPRCRYGSCAPGEGACAVDGPAQGRNARYNCAKDLTSWLPRLPFAGACWHQQEPAAAEHAQLRMMMKWKKHALRDRQ
jgi:hypothetical protein